MKLLHKRVVRTELDIYVFTFMQSNAVSRNDSENVPPDKKKLKVLFIINFFRHNKAIIMVIVHHLETIGKTFI
jgi:hypothetical protein